MMCEALQAIPGIGEIKINMGANVSRMTAAAVA